MLKSLNAWFYWKEWLMMQVAKASKDIFVPAINRTARMVIGSHRPGFLFGLKALKNQT
jgi:hypothetical protein